MNTPIYDLVILGGGPAGCAAAVYAARKQLKTALVAAEFGGQSNVSEKIYNWIGTPEISGLDLGKNLKAHAVAYKGETLDIFEGELATSVTKIENGYLIKTNKQELSTKSILVTTGSSRRKLDIPGASTYENKGVVYCASCDGPLFSGMNVVVIGAGNAGFESAAQLAAYCPSVTLLNRTDVFKADEITVKAVSAMPNVHIKTFTEPVEVVGEKFVKGIRVRNNQTGEEEILPVGGVFVEIGQIPNTGYLGNLVEKTEYNNLITDPRNQKTSAPGIWAAGDCTDGLYHQNNIAAGDAVKAVEDIYLELKAK